MRLLKLNTMLATAIAVTAMIFVACSSDDTIDERRTAGAIGFAPLLDRNTSGTRSTGTANVIGAETDDKFDGFYVWGYTMGDAVKSAKNSIYLYKQSTTAGGVPIQKADVSGGTGWGTASDNSNKYYGYLNAEDLKYWPQDKLEFVAIGPLSKVDDATNGSDISQLTNTSFTATRPTNSQYTFDYEATAGSNPDLTKHTDIVYATARQTGTVGNSTVSLAFKHALSKIKFQGYVGANQPGLTVIIKDITLCNVNTKGTATIEVTGDATNTLTWSPNTNGNYTLTKSTSPITLSANATVASDGATADLTDEILVIPQTHGVWQNGAIAAANTASSEKTYLKIDCVIYQVDGVPIVGTVVNSGEEVTSTGGTKYTCGSVYAHMVANPATESSLTWAAGTNYVYTLKFGVGKDENGNVISAPITFTVSSVAAWTNTTVNTNL